MLSALAWLASAGGAHGAPASAAVAASGADAAPLDALSLGGLPLETWLLIGASAAVGIAFLALALGARRWLARLSLRDRVLVALTASLALVGVTLPAVPVLAVAGVVLGPFAFLAGDLFFKLGLFVFVGALIAWVPRPGTYALFYLLWMAGQTLLSGYLSYGPIVLLFAAIAVMLVEAAGWASGLTRGRDVSAVWAGLAIGVVEAAVVYWDVRLLQAYFRFDLPQPLVLLQAASGGLSAGVGFAVGTAWGRRLRAVQRPAMPPSGPYQPHDPEVRPVAAAGPVHLEVSGLVCGETGSGRPAVNTVSFALRGGEIALLAGPTGCGKSTLLRALQGLVPVAAGSIRLDGRDRAAFSPAAWARYCGLLMQEPDLQLLRLTPAGEIALALELRDASPDAPRRRVRSPGPERDAVLRALAPLDLESLADRPLAQLSGVERLRVALAALLASGPRVLLLDEPLAHLDAAHRERLIALLRGLAERGTAVLVAEHRAAELAPAAARVLWMDGGRVTEVAALVRTGVPGVEPGEYAAAARPARSAAQTILRLERVAWRHPGSAQPLFEDVTAQITGGAAVLLRGANGQGKTTLLELIAGLRRPSAGRIARDGRAVHTLSWSARSRWIGWLPQRADLILCARTVAEELALPLRARGHAEARVREAVGAWLERLDLGRQAGQFPHLLSRGERQRLALGTVLIAAPGLLLLDEPFAGQDPRQTRAIAGLLRAYLSEDPRRAVIAATHDLEPALAWADTVWTLDGGRLSSAENPAAGETLAAPAPTAVALSAGSVLPPVPIAQGGRP